MGSEARAAELTPAPTTAAESALEGPRAETAANAAQDDFSRLVSAADLQRDRREYASAAELYRRAVGQAPDRTDLLVQFGNMLKDAGRLQEAGEAYRRAISQEPAIADTRLQLGHVLKLSGRRAEAIEAYESALSLDPECHDAARELFHLGSSPHQERVAARQERAGAYEALLTLSSEVARLEAVLAEWRGRLPEISAGSAFPLAAYDLYRAYHAVPPPPAGSAALRLLVLCAVEKSDPLAVERQVRSLAQQEHERFAFCALGSRLDLRAALERARTADARFRWCETRDVAAEERRLIAAEPCDAVLLLETGRELHPKALAWFAHALNRHDAAAWVSDEEILSEDRAANLRPLFRRIVDVDTLRELNPYGETVAARRAWLLADPDEQSAGAVGDRHALLLRLTKASSVGHLPLPLVRCRAGDGEVAPPPRPGGSPEASVGAVPGASPDLHVIVPTRDNAADLVAFLDSLAKQAAWPNRLRFVVVDNGTTSATDRVLLEGLGRRPRHQVCSHEGRFNWSRMNNLAAATCGEGLIVFANDDMLMHSADWDRHVVGLLSRPGVGAAGAKLLYPDGTVQHAGVLLGWRGSAIHDGLHEAHGAAGPASRWTTTRAASAVTGAFLCTPSALFHELGGFDDLELPVAYSDVDYGLRLRARGFRVLWSPHIVVRHHESKSRGLDHLDPERAARAGAEAAVMRGRWGSALDFDPSVHPLFTDVSRPFRLIRAPPPGAIDRYMEISASRAPWNVDDRRSRGAGTFPP